MKLNHQYINLILIFSCLLIITSCKQKKKSLVINSKNTDQWIDKNENENYTPRHECSFVQAGDKFIMFGGRESAQKLENYDFKNNTWSVSKNKAPKQFNHFQATFYKGFVWVIGAFKTNKFPKEMPEENIWLYFPPTDTWIKGPEIPKNRRRGGAGLVVFNNKFYLIGGNTIGHNGGYVNWFDEYDPEKNTWTVLENASQARDHFSAAVYNNKLYAAAGRHSGGEGGVFAPLVSIVDVYDFNTKKWSILNQDLPTPRAAPSISVFNDELLVMGGESVEKGPAYKIVEAYNFKTEKWSRKMDMHYPRHGTQSIISGNGVYIAGGSPNQGGGRQLNMEVYNEDKPAGTALIASKLEALQEVKCNPNTSKKIIIKNTNGNTGTFINSIELIQPDSLAFKINSNMNLTFVNANSEFSIPIECLKKTPSNATLLKIVYNGNQEKTIKLTCN